MKIAYLTIQNSDNSGIIRFTNNFYSTKIDEPAAVWVHICLSWTLCFSIWHQDTGFYLFPYKAPNFVLSTCPECGSDWCVCVGPKSRLITNVTPVETCSQTWWGWEVTWRETTYGHSLVNRVRHCWTNIELGENTQEKVEQRFYYLLYITKYFYDRSEGIPINCKWC